MKSSPVDLGRPTGATEHHLEPRLLKGSQADYDPAPAYPGHNPSGLLPLGPNVLVRIDTCALASSGGVMLTPERIERMDLASESGVIYAMGQSAWRGYGPDERPKLGDRVYFQRFAGLTGNGRDGGKYRIMDDTCIACLVEIDADGQLPTGVGMGAQD